MPKNTTHPSAGVNRIYGWVHLLQIIPMTKFRLLLAALLLAGIGFYFYSQPAPDRSTESAQTAVESKVLYKALAGGDAADYLDQVVAVTGVVKGVDGKTVMLRPGIACRMEGEFEVPTAGETITVKGRVLGYDDMFGEVQLDFGVFE